MPAVSETSLSSHQKIKRKARQIPYGYRIDPQNEKSLLPVDIELEALAKAKEFLKVSSYQQVCDWMFKVTGRPISGPGLRKVFKRGY